MKKTLYLVTQEFPYGHREDSFVKLEYPYLQKVFDVTIIATELEMIETSYTLDYHPAYLISKKQGVWDKVYSLLLFLMKPECYSELVRLIKIRKSVFKRIIRALMYGIAAETFYRRLKEVVKLNPKTDAIVYFYWFDYHCLGLTMHLDKYPNIRVISRTHGYDLYDERELYGIQFFKPQMDKKLYKLIFAAQYAKEYYLSRYQKKDGEKYSVNRLGVTDKHVTAETRQAHLNTNSTFTILSCSALIPLKRINMIIEGLATIESQKTVRWIHIGEGSELNALKELANVKLGSKKNLQYQFLGVMMNEDVLKYYEDNFISCFITTTETEGGAPVSVQEALSYGVPIIATDIGELKQMVKTNGILLSVNLDANEVGVAIDDILNIYDTEKYWQMCQESLEIFRNKFNKEINYSDMIQELKTI